MDELSAKLFQDAKDISEKFPERVKNHWILIDTSLQKMYLLDNLTLLCDFSISTSKFGLGGEQDSYKTPLGAHEIAECIGEGCQLYEIFEARQATGNIAEIEHRDMSTDSDLILTRIMRLKGLEAKKNLGEGIDSYSRYIYIHGTHEEGLLGKPASHGCVRMSNEDVVDLYNQVNEKTFVYIQ